MSVSLIDGHIDPEKQKFLLYIPADGNYIEILGYKIDGFESFEAFCEHLNKYAEMEKEILRLQQNLKEAHIDIQEKQAEIEALIAGQETLQKYIAEKDAEVKQYKARILNDTEYIEKIEVENRKQRAEIERLLQKLQQPQSEAVKEFAERLKYNFKGDSVCDFLFVRITIETVEKEMVGEG